MPVRVQMNLKPQDHNPKDVHWQSFKNQFQKRKEPQKKMRPKMRLECNHLVSYFAFILAVEELIYDCTQLKILNTNTFSKPLFQALTLHIFQSTQILQRMLFVLERKRLILIWTTVLCCGRSLLILRMEIFQVIIYSSFKIF